MLSFVKNCILVIFTICFYSFSHSQDIPFVRITGKVIDAKTGVGIYYANVFLSNTTLGAATNEDGYFTIENIPLGQYELVVSVVGYGNEVLALKFTQSAEEDLLFKLISEPIQTPEIVVTATHPREWKKNLKEFETFIFGESKNAAKCKILNPEVLDFTFDEESKEFTASASGLLEIVNQGLGYRIYAELIDFQLRDGSDFKYKAHLTFELLPHQDEKEWKRWEKNRREAYNGSLRHFLASLSSGTLDEEGFLLYNVTGLDETDRHYILKDQYPEEIVFAGEYPYERKILFSNFLKVVYTPEYEPHVYRMYLDGNPFVADDGRMKIRVGDERETGQTSWFSLQSGNYLSVNTLGHAYNPYALKTFGYMAWERLSEQLPLDYTPSPPVEKLAEASSSVLDWESLRPQTDYFKILYSADSLSFVQNFEYPFLLVMNEKDEEEYPKGRTVLERKRFIEQLIRRKNQNPLLPVNYWLIEFWGRYAYARKHFKIRKPPFIDARGLCYMKYGQPVDRYQDQGGLKFAEFLRDYRIMRIMRILYNMTPPPVDFLVKPNETWYYTNQNNQFSVHFVKEREGFEEVRSLDKALHTHQNRNLCWHWMQLVKDRETVSPDLSMMSETIRQIEYIFKQADFEYVEVSPDKKAVEVFRGFPADIQNRINIDRPHEVIRGDKVIFESEERTYRSNAVPNVDDRFLKLNKLDFTFNISQFKHETGKTRVELVPLIPVESLMKKRGESVSSDTIPLDYRFMIRDENFKPYMRIGFEDMCIHTRLKEKGLSNALCRAMIPVEPIKGELTVQITDMVSSNRGFRKQPIEIRDFSGEETMFSDIQLYKKVEDEELKSIVPVFEINDIMVLPYPNQQINKSDLLYCYLEVYNLFSLRPLIAYEQEIRVVHADSKKGISRLFARSQEYEISMVHERDILENDSKELIALDLTKLKNGEYVLEINILLPETDRVLASTNRKISVIN